MKVLVTGANGFIGRALCRHLVAEGISVRGLVRPGSTLGTLTDLPAVEVTHGDVLSVESLSRTPRARNRLRSSSLLLRSSTASALATSPRRTSSPTSSSYAWS